MKMLNFILPILFVGVIVGAVIYFKLRNKPRNYGFIPILENEGE